MKMHVITYKEAVYLFNDLCISIPNMPTNYEMKIYGELLSLLT